MVAATIGATISVIRVFTVVAALGLVLAVGSSPASANTFGHRYLKVNECCNGAGLYGTKAAIRTPPSAAYLTFPADGNDCILGRSEASVTNVALIQTGWVRCAPGHPGLMNSCSSIPSNPLVQFAEKRNGGGSYFCLPWGTIPYNTNVYYSVKKECCNGQWYGYIGGVKVEDWSTSMGGSEFLREGVESTGTCSESFTVLGDFAEGVPWQRWTGTSWFTVQSSSKTLDCGWWDFGAPPASFGFGHG